MVKRIILWLLVLLWMGVIYGFSSETGETSGGRSQAITKSIQGVIDSTPLKGKISWSEVATRKTAHVAEYLILSLLLYFALGSSGFNGKGRIITALIAALAYAALDEFHQSFTAGRGPSVKDVMIDGIGVMLGAAAGSIASRSRAGKSKKR